MNVIEYGTEFLDQLKDSVHDLYDENKELKKEIERLKEEYMILQNSSDEVEEELQQRINKAIEYIEQQDKWFKNEEYKLIKEKDLLDILKGSNKE